MSASTVKLPGTSGEYSQWLKPRHIYGDDEMARFTAGVAAMPERVREGTAGTWHELVLCSLILAGVDVDYDREMESFAFRSGRWDTANKCWQCGASCGWAFTRCLDCEYRGGGRLGEHDPDERPDPVRSVGARLAEGFRMLGYE